MSGKRQRKEQLQGNSGGGSKKRSALVWMLCVALTFGSVCVPEYAGMPVQAAGLGEMSVQAAESAGMPAEMSKEMSGEEPEGTLTAGSGGETVTEQEGIEEPSSEEECSEENYSSWDAADGSEGDGVPGNGTMLSAEDDIAGGTYGNVTWRIDADGTLTVEGTGEFTYSAPFPERVLWRQWKESIKSAVVRVTGMQDASFMFYGCYNLTSLDLSGLDTSSVTDMHSMFYGCSSLTSLDMSKFATGSVTNMKDMFDGCSGLTSLDVSGFDTSSVGGMSGMFRGCSSLTSLDVSGFDTRNVTDMSCMFWGCSSLTSLDVSGFDTRNVTSMYDMFNGCSGLTSLDVSKFDTRNVASMGGMFWDCSSLTSLDVSGFDTSSVGGMSGMFRGCSSLTSLDVSRFDTSSVGGMWKMFSGCNSLTSLDVSKFDTSSVKDMYGMFQGCSSLTSLDVSKFDTRNVTSMENMFSGCSGLTSLDVSKFATGSVTSMRAMFSGCSGLTSLDVSGFDTIGVTDMGYMFSGCGSLTSLDVSKFATGSVVVMYGMFGGCSSLTSLDVSRFDTRNVTSMSDMFNGCSGLTSLDVSKFETGNVTSMGDMFSGCSGLTSLDVSKFDTGSVTSMENMFKGCSGLTSLDVSKFATGSVTSMKAMFEGCGGLTSLDVSGFDTGSVRKTWLMFHDCSGLTSLDLSGFDMSSVEDGYRDAMFHDCSSLKTLHTPRNVHAVGGRTVALPGVWRDAAGNLYTQLPEGLDYSIVLTKTTESGSEKVDDDGMSVYFVGEDGELVTPADYVATYNGAAIKPLVRIYNNEKLLAEGTDYTVKYKNNTNAGTAILTVSGKGNFSGAANALNFTINKAVLGTDVSVPSAMTVAVNTKVAPVLMCGARKLGTKDFTISGEGLDANFKYAAAGEYTLTVKAAGANYADETEDGVTIAVKVVEKPALGKLIVKLDSSAAKNVTYDGKSHAPADLIESGVITVNDGLKPKNDDGTLNYQIVCRADTVNAGTVKFTIVGCGAYGGSVAKSYKINPAGKDGMFDIRVADGVNAVEYTAAGAKLPGFNITFRNDAASDALELVEGTDYKVTYSGNRKVGTGKYAISFLGNYKGSKPAAAKGTFEITKAKADSENTVVVLPNKTYAKAGKAYKSTPIVTVNGALVKASDYSVDYQVRKENDADFGNVDNTVKIDLGNDNYATVQVTIKFDKPKGSYEAESGKVITGTYEVRKADNAAIDLSKAKVTFYSDEACSRQLKSLEYNGFGFCTPGEGNTSDAVNIDEAEAVYVKVDVKGVDSNSLKGLYTVNWTNSNAKGKATVVINGTGETLEGGNKTAVGSKNASISIKAMSIKGKNFASVLQEIWSNRF